MLSFLVQAGIVFYLIPKWSGVKHCWFNRHFPSMLAFLSTPMHFYTLGEERRPLIKTTRCFAGTIVHTFWKLHCTIFTPWRWGLHSRSLFHTFCCPPLESYTRPWPCAECQRSPPPSIWFATCSVCPVTLLKWGAGGGRRRCLLTIF